jgi:hypothetical protein
VCRRVDLPLLPHLCESVEIVIRPKNRDTLTNGLKYLS